MLKNYFIKYIFLFLLGIMSSALIGQTTTFNYTGSAQPWTVPNGVTSIEVDVYGAQGGDGDYATNYGGNGGRVQAIIAVTPGETLEIYVGGQGVSTTTPASGGWNGGGNTLKTVGSGMSGTGGGGTDIRVSPYSVTDRIIVAGGGGGSGYQDYAGAAGGDLIGQDAVAYPSFPTSGGKGGTQIAGGAAGNSALPNYLCTPGTLFQGGTGDGDGAGSGGGGGGYYGGGGGMFCGGGGGSSYTIPSATSVTHTQGVQSGNGIVTITTLCVPLTITTSPATNVCPGTMVTITATSSNGGTITWDNGITNGIPFLATSTTTYTATSSDINDCGTIIEIVVEDLINPVSPTLTDVTGECTATAVAPTTTDLCAGTITGTTTDALTYTTQGTHVITWNFDDGNGNDIDINQNVVIADVTNPVSPTLADVTGECTATAVAPTTTDNCSGTITATTTDALTYSTQGTHTITWNFDDGNGNDIDVTQDVVITDITAPTIVCPNDTVVCDSIVNYLTPIGLDNCTGQSTLLTLGLGSSSTFPVGVTIEEYTVTDIGGNTASCSFTVTVNSLMVDLGADTTICAGDTATLYAGIFDTYLWSTGETTQTIFVDSAGLGIGIHEFFVTAMDTNGCEAIDTVLVTIDICSGIVSNDVENQIKIYPNPSTGMYTISADRYYSFVITDIAGKQIYSGKLENKETQIDISDEAQGIYLIKFINEKFSKTIKLMKK